MCCRLIRGPSFEEEYIPTDSARFINDTINNVDSAQYNPPVAAVRKELGTLIGQEKDSFAVQYKSPSIIVGQDLTKTRGLKAHD